MPIYEYECVDCGHKFEALLRGSESPACQACGSNKLDKLLSVPAAHTTGGLPICDGPPPGQGPCGMGGCGLPDCG